MRQPMHDAKSYAYVIERADDGGYWAYLPDLPGCASAGDSPEEVEQQLPEAVELYLSYFREKGLPLPAAQAKVGSLPRLEGKAPLISTTRITSSPPNAARRF